MKHKRNKLLSAVLGVSFIGTCMLFAGDLNPSGLPDNNSSAMFTLEDLYQRLLNGTTGSKRSGSFAEPSTGPTSGTMHNLNDLMEKMPVKDDTNGATDANVLQGKNFWGLTSGQWGAKAGAMPNIGQQNVNPSTSNQAISEGYHNGTGRVTGDADLVAGNIRSGINLFGVDGDSNVVNTSSGNAVNANISLNKKAWVDGSEVTGTLVGGTNCTGTFSALGRWCNNGNGTVTDTTTGLIWYIRGNNFWGTYASATAYISNHQHGLDGLTDGSSAYDWRLPTMNEMLHITAGTEAISNSNQYFFTGIQNDWYWTCSGYTTSSPQKIMKVTIPYTNPVGNAELPSALMQAMAVRNP